MNINKLNNLSESDAFQSFEKCCGSVAWVSKMIALMPFKNPDEIFIKAEEIWFAASKNDWLDAFKHHPEIGDLKSMERKFAATKQWAGDEQKSVISAPDDVIEQFVKLNKEYKKKFGYICIICATGKTANEMLGILKTRICNAPEKEIRTAMQEQNKIIRLRLEKLLNNL